MTAGDQQHGAPSSFAGSRSMATNYQQDGVDVYYQQHGTSYRNPHFPGIVSSVFAVLQAWSKDVLIATHGSELPPQLLQALSQPTPYRHRPSPPHAKPTPQPQPSIMPGTTTPAQPQQSQPHVANPHSLDEDSSTQPLPAAPQASHVIPQPSQPGTSQPDTTQSPASQATPTTAPPDPLTARHRGAMIPPACSSTTHGYGPGPCIRVLDLACGSGEATQAVAAWWHTVAGPPSTPHDAQQQLEDGMQSITVHDETSPVSSEQLCQASRAELGPVSTWPGHGPQDWAPEAAAEAAAAAAPVTASSTSGGGSVPTTTPTTLTAAPAPAAGGLGVGLCIDAADPYTGAAFTSWTGREAETFSFQDVASGWLSDEGRSYHLVVCSYAMHVLEPSYLFPTLQQLALACEALVIISPHKLPLVEPHTGWELVHQLVVERVHARLYTSNTLLAGEELSLLRTP